jgi:sugar/nucleoside kinase (ribokinase family)
MKKTLIIGPVFTEILNDVDELPKGNEDFIPKHTEQRVRGSGYETARVLNGFGFPYELIAPAGTGIYGDLVKKECAENHVPVIAKPGINGCMYTLTDAKGRKGYMCVPGAEYEFDLEDIQYIDPEEISLAAVFGSMLTGENASDLIQALDDLNQPILFIPENRGDEIDEEIMKEMLALQPQLFLTDSEAYFIAGACTNDMKETADALYHESEAAVMIYQEQEGIYTEDGDEPALVPCHRKIQFNMLTAGYIAAIAAGISRQSALRYAVSFAEDCGRAMPDSSLFEREKRQLAKMILGK